MRGVLGGQPRATRGRHDPRMTPHSPHPAGRIGSMATLTHTFTRTHVTFSPANPFLACAVCGKRAEAFHDDACGCDPENYPNFSQPINFPCMHASADYDDLCPSWGPVDGCQCLTHLGYVPHPAVLATA